ncbi:MAG: hypothetical protein LQ346_007711 [Caloplaca aetnensis]|nr:MAG: hypothetical protein LQ346_007711 [Caloplaca aetnensis]
MDPHAEIWEDIMYPTALFASDKNQFPADPPTAWEESLLNPVNRITSLDPDHNSNWRIDGAEKDGTRFFAVPKSAIGRPPMRIDVFIPDQSKIDRPLRDLLGTSYISLVPSSTISSLAISQHLLKALDYWSSGQPEFESTYMSMPFGSRIMVDTLKCDVKAMEIEFLPLYSVEQQWLSVASLQEMWHLPPSQWPELLDIGHVHFHHQLHDAITLVRIPQKSETDLYAFKSLTHDLKFMYHELRTLLTMRPHPNVISKPLYLITQKCRFGGKVGVCGFILEYHSGGNLRDALRRDSPTLRTVGERLRAAAGITSALLHIQSDWCGFYSDLKLPNIVLSSSHKDSKAILVDFEQRGGWFSWSPPEVYYLDYLEYLAVFGPMAEQATYRDKMHDLIPDWKPRSSKSKYVDCPHGYSTSWNHLTAEGHEAAVVYMLGKMLWCLLEGVGSMNGMIMNPESFRDESSELVFPQFQHTPMRLRDCIRRCTAGAPEWEGQKPCVEFRAGRVYPHGKTGTGTEVMGTEAETQAAAKAWWATEMQRAETFLYARRQCPAGASEDSEIHELFHRIRERPKLEEVLQVLAEV